MTFRKDEVTLSKAGVTFWKETKLHQIMKSIIDTESPRVTLYQLFKKNINWIRLPRVVLAKDGTVCEVYASIRHAGANNVILISEKVNQTMRLGI